MASRNVPSSSMREDDGEDEEIVSLTTKLKPKPLVAYGDRMPFRGDSESPVSFSEVREAPPDRRLSEELRRCKSLRYAKEPPLISKKTRQITLTSSKSFDADVLAAILNVEDDIGDLPKHILLVVL